MDLRGKSAVVTGGAKGIGFSTAGRLVKAGCSVMLWDIDRSALEDARERLSGAGGIVHTAVCDVTDRSSVFARAEEAEEILSGVDILVNNAGTMAPGYFLEQPVEEWERTVGTNLTSILYTIYAFLPRMYARKSGHIVNISSAAGLTGVSALSAYSASKWAVLGLTESLREEARSLGQRDVRFSSVHPMFLASGMFEGARLRGLGSLFFPRVRNHDVIAKAIVDEALGKGRKMVMRPRSLRLVPLLRGILPAPAFLWLGRFLNVHTSMETWKGAAGEAEAKK